MMLQGRRAFITGSFQGIGLGIATALAAEGASIVLHGIADEKAMTKAEKIVSSLIAKILASGPIDILCNNAGIQRTGLIENLSRDTWDDILAVNLTSYFDTMKLLLPQMKERGYGRVINTSSVHGLIASVEKAPYVAAKHGVVGLTKVAALEYAHVGNAETGGVTINAICPGWVETDLIEPQIQAKVDLQNGDRAAGIADLLSEKQPSKRMSKPSDIGAIALFLCSKNAHNITGASISVDGGWSAQ